MEPVSAEEIENYLRELRHSDPKDRDVFHARFSEGMRISGLSLQDAAEILLTAPGSVSRWANRHSAPAQPVRDAALMLIGVALRYKLCELRKATRTQ